MLKLPIIKIKQNIPLETIVKKALQKNNIHSEDVLSWKILKKSVDARKKNDVCLIYSLGIIVKNENNYSHLEKVVESPPPNICIKRNSSLSPIIVGAGPAGLFAALWLAEAGTKPIILEQGKTVQERQKDVDYFLTTGTLNPFSNIQFGEGGAGTFSDGKLTTGIHSPFCHAVLESFVKFGAPSSILYESKPHIGTDNLVVLLKNMRNYIENKGGTFYFETKAIDFVTKNGEINQVIGENQKNHEQVSWETDCVILAIGHSSRDTFQKAMEIGLSLVPKNFSVGVRIEHLQEKINEAQWGTQTSLTLPAADYKLAYHSPSGRSCYTFCMCPGGTVMASSSDLGTIVTNGMSKYAREGINANSALLVNVTPDDFPGNSPLRGCAFQRQLEEKAFTLGGSNYFAPVQRVEDFLLNQPTTHLGKVKPTYLPGVKLSNLTTILPEFVSSTLREGILSFDTKLKGFADPDAILTGVETRSSSPVRIIRNEQLMANIKGIYPCGEGAGYAGGIMSAAVDGIKCATSILSTSSI